MLKSHSIRSAIVLLLFSLAGFFAGAPPAQASPVQITLNSITFAGSSGSEIFTGSFFYDPVLNAISSVSILGTGATDASLGGFADMFGSVVPTGIEPDQFAFSDAFNDFLVLNLPLGLSNSNYGFSDADISLGLLFSVVGFSPEAASFGDFSVNGGVASTPEPRALLLLLTGLVLLGLRRFVRELHRSQARVPSLLSR
ncbi:MAG: PEP-CTERM sorting domain-containing protein [Terriglobales bacterium]